MNGTNFFDSAGGSSGFGGMGAANKRKKPTMPLSDFTQPVPGMAEAAATGVKKASLAQQPQFRQESPVAGGLLEGYQTAVDPLMAPLTGQSKLMSTPSGEFGGLEQWGKQIGEGVNVAGPAASKALDPTQTDAFQYLLTGKSPTTATTPPTTAPAPAPQPTIGAVGAAATTPPKPPTSSPIDYDPFTRDAAGDFMDLPKGGMGLKGEWGDPAQKMTAETMPSWMRQGGIVQPRSPTEIQFTGKEPGHALGAPISEGGGPDMSWARSLPGPTQEALRQITAGTEDQRRMRESAFAQESESMGLQNEALRQKLAMLPLDQQLAFLKSQEAMQGLQRGSLELGDYSQRQALGQFNSLLQQYNDMMPGPEKEQVGKMLDYFRQKGMPGLPGQAPTTPKAEQATAGPEEAGFLRSAAHTGVPSAVAAGVWPMMGRLASKAPIPGPWGTAAKVGGSLLAGWGAGKGMQALDPKFSEMQPNLPGALTGTAAGLVTGGVGARSLMGAPKTPPTTGGTGSATAAPTTPTLAPDPQLQLPFGTTQPGQKVWPGFGSTGATTRPPAMPSMGNVYVPPKPAGGGAAPGGGGAGKEAGAVTSPMGKTGTAQAKTPAQKASGKAQRPVTVKQTKAEGKDPAAQIKFTKKQAQQLREMTTGKVGSLQPTKTTPPISGATATPATSSGAKKVKPGMSGQEAWSASMEGLQSLATPSPSPDEMEKALRSAVKGKGALPKPSAKWPSELGVSGVKSPMTPEQAEKLKATLGRIGTATPKKKSK